METGRGIAVAGIWIGAGIMAFAAPSGVVAIAICAAVATMFMG